MKHITKGRPPPELARWFEGQPLEHGRRINCGYGDIPTGVKKLVKQRLLEEQGYLCCYTGRRIDETGSHIERLKPQAACANHEDIAYDNMLAAFPGAGQHCEFGAVAKRDWNDPTLMVSPLHGGCEARFRFTQFGKIKAAPDDQGAAETLGRLKLDHDTLTEWRSRAIVGALFPKGRGLSEAQLQKVATGYCTRDRHTQQFYPYCFVIKHVAYDLLRRRDQERKKQAGSRQAKST